MQRHPCLQFVLAGDFLVFKFPTWQWQSGREQQQRSYLPSQKQFLCTRNGQIINDALLFIPVHDLCELLMLSLFLVLLLSLLLMLMLMF
jgi:hypothetical protein